MDSITASYRGHRFPPEIISHAVWLYHRFCLSFRDVEDLLAERGIAVSYESIRHWCRKFGTGYARRLKRREGRLGDTWHLGELFVTIQGLRQYLWRAVDQDGDVIVYVPNPGAMTFDRAESRLAAAKLTVAAGEDSNHRADVGHTQPNFRVSY